ncbi:hypothetical protein PRZ48_009177 [Zasmidium cellare]|uniref:Uncharacterized protein n=1 Tax=Zasmidium cellare TaxID=395010 RepID=A0ABR0EB06_ZASCE|nr:hypothetical protein PRZ48_009177 [Zasmidium cellare]
MVEAALHGQRGALQAIAAHHRPDDETSLQLLENAAFSGDVETLLYAVEIATNERSQREWPPLILHRLAQFGQHEAMQKAIELGVDVEATLKNETATPLYIAAKYGQSSAAKCLTWHGAMVDKASKMKPSLPLEIACLSGDIDTVRALIQAEHKQMHGELGVFRSSSLPKALETAARCGFAEAAEVLTSDIEEPATMRAAAERALCYISRHLVHPPHNFEAVGPEFDGEPQAEEPVDDRMSVFGSLPSSRRVSKAGNLPSAEAEAESEGYVTAHEA